MLLGSLNSKTHVKAMALELYSCRKDTGLNAPITHMLITVWLTVLILLVLHYSTDILGIKKTIKLIHSSNSSFLSSLCLQNISNNHLDTAGAEAITSLLLDNVSCLHTLQLSGGLYAPKQRWQWKWNSIYFIPVSHPENISQTMGKINPSAMSLTGTQSNSGNLDL